MSPDMECDAVNVTNQAIEDILGLTDVKDNEKMSKMSAFIKKELDGKYGSGWFVICGRNYGSYVSHELNTFMHYCFGDLNFTIFKAC
jgi:dynein light chain LC8-type